MPLKVHRDELPTINLTSMIDVLFLLIIFFMVGTNFGMPEKHLALDLPKVGATQSVSSGIERKTIDVRRDGMVYMDGNAVPLRQLNQQLKALRQSMSKEQAARFAIIVRSERNTTVETLMEVTHAVSEAGISRVSMAVDDSTRR